MAFKRSLGGFGQGLQRGKKRFKSTGNRLPIIIAGIRGGVAELPRLSSHRTAMPTV